MVSLGLGATGSCIAPPPGLEAFLPAKVELRDDSEIHGHFTVDSQAQVDVHTLSAPQHPGEWLQTISEVTPFLNAEGIRQALLIVDSAIQNAARAKALDEAIGNADASGTMLWTAMQLRAEVGEQQQQLLNELQLLRLRYGIGPADPCRIADDGFGAVETEFWATKLEHSPAPAPAVWTPKQPVDRAPRPSGRQDQTLSTSLQLLSQEDPGCLFIVRRINKLGFKAAKILKSHFVNYGAVVRVLVAHSTVRQHRDPERRARRRPSSLGFVQMAASDAVLKVLASGEEQQVAGTFIRVQKFERQSAEAYYDQDGEEADNGDAFKWERHYSGISEATTASTATPSSEGGGSWVEADFQ